MIEDPLGHLALFGVAPTYMPQIDRHLTEPLDAAVDVGQVGSHPLAEHARDAANERQRDSELYYEIRARERRFC